MVQRNAIFRAVLGTTQGEVGAENPPSRITGRWSTLFCLVRQAKAFATSLLDRRSDPEQDVVFLGRILCDSHLHLAKKCEGVPHRGGS